MIIAGIIILLISITGTVSAFYDGLFEVSPTIGSGFTLFILIGITLIVLGIYRKDKR